MGTYQRGKDDQEQHGVDSPEHPGVRQDLKEGKDGTVESASGTAVVEEAVSE